MLATISVCPQTSSLLANSPVEADGCGTSDQSQAFRQHVSALLGNDCSNCNDKLPALACVTADDAVL